MALAALCGGSEAALAGVDVAPFGTMADGRPIHLYTLSTPGLTVRVTDLGGIITAIETPDRAGRTADIVLGFATADQYRARDNQYFFGVPVGRFANRIAGARVTIDGQSYALAANNGPNTLHSGRPYYHERLWAARPFTRGGRSGVTLELVSPDGDQGFPGRLVLRLRYSVGPDHALRIDYRATTSRPTFVNFTNHSYFNLAGEGSGDVGGQSIQIRADRLAERDAAGLPTGRIVPVTGPYDLRAPRRIGDGIAAIKAQGGSGYDDSYVLADRPFARPRLVAEARDPASGRTLTVLTTEPSLQFYTANSAWGTDAGPSGRVYRRHGGFALETQHLPDSPHHPDFPTTLLRPGQTFRSTTLYRFGVEGG
ncbi:aldose epimerase family protein [Sphingomonas morindae]|uniref:Aldose 1-epimerase n=1 Tax=Sphingomonas morindae TaxID=1541170 RepID=A0ABY4XE65_9SPHN|nr:aldose epimerase family protein [Sphingomonas morindae]USI75071.1 galactose mutarotase [Sphingomonas morindae]